MHRIDGDANVGGAFSEGNPGTGTPGTAITADWLNGVQEEICAAIEGAGLPLNKPDTTQLAAAIAALIAAHDAVTAPHSASAAPEAERLVVRDASGRAQVASPSAPGDIANRGYVDARMLFSMIAGGLFNAGTGVAAAWSQGMTAASGGTGVLNFTFGTPRASVSYGVLATPSGQTLVQVTNKTVNGFSLEFRNLAGALAAPGGTVDVLVLGA